jgi:hypothetical protein
VPDHIYRIIYEGVPDRANRGIDALLAHLAKLDAAVDRLNPKLKTLGADPAGLRKMEAVVGVLEAALKGLGADAARVEAALKAVGKGNSSVTALTKRLKELEAELKAVQAAAASATPVVAGVGSGSTIGGGKGVGKGGVSQRGLVVGMAAGMAMQGLRSAAGTIGESLGNRRKYLSETADMASDYRKQLGELGVLQGKNAPDDELIREDLAFQRQSVMDPDASRTFRLEFGGAISPALKARDKTGQPNITPEVAKKLEVEGAKFTARYGLDAQTGGRMAGLLGVTQKVPTAEAGLGIMAETMEMLNVEGVGPVKTLAGQLLSLSGGMLENGGGENEDGEGGGGGRFKSFPEMAARYAASTVAQAGNAARAKTRIVQSDRLLRKLAHDRESPLGQKAQITPEDDYESAIRKLAPHIAGSGGDRAMVESGYKNSTERLAVIEEAKMNGIVDQSLADPRKKAKAARAVQDNAAYAGTTVARQQSAENAEFTSAIETGLAGERMKAARAEARARMADPNQPGGQQLKATGWQSFLDEAQSRMTSMHGIPGEELRVDTEAMAGLIRGGEKVGVDVRKLAPHASYRMDSGQNLDDDASRVQFNKAYQAVEKAGGDPMGGSPRDAAEALRKAATALDALGRGGGGGGGSPPPGNGGSGVNPGRR